MPKTPAGSTSAAVELEPATMAVSMAHVLTMLSIMQHVLRVGDWTGTAVEDPLQQHVEKQSQMMAWLMEEMERRSQGLQGLVQEDSLSQEDVFVTVSQYWWVWVSANALLVLFGLCWPPRWRSIGSEGSSQQGSTNSVEERKQDDWKDKPDPGDTLGTDKCMDNETSSSALDMPFTRTCF